MKQSVSALLVTAALALAGTATAAEVGKPAPDFKLKDEAGRTHTLEQYRGKIVVLEWTNPECPYVQRHYQANTMETLAKSYDGKKVVWLAVDSTAHNTPEKSAAWKKAQGFSYPILQDPGGALGKAYGARTTPHMYVIDEKGVVRFIGGIDDDPRGRSEKPTNYVKAAVDALLSGKEIPQVTSEPYGCSVKYRS